MPTTTLAASLHARPTAWSDIATLQQVDPASGIQSITLSLTGQTLSVVSVRNYDLAPALFDSTSFGSVTLFRPDGSVWLRAAPAASVHAVLSAASEPGGAPVQLIANGTATSSVGYYPAATSSPDAALLVGTGEVTLPVTASARVHAVGPANMAALFTSWVGANVSLTAATGDGPGGGFSGGIDTTFTPAPVASINYGGTTITQTRTAEDATIGASSTLTFNPFDTSLGVLDSATLSVAADAAGSARLESLDPVAGTATVGQSATVAVQDVSGAIGGRSTASISTTRQLGAFDGTDDFAGLSSAAVTATIPAGAAIPTMTTLVGVNLAAFRGGPVVLGVSRTGTTTLDAPGNLDVATTLQAGAQVTLAYHYVSPDLSYTNTATGVSGTLTPDLYAGPVAGLQRQYIWPGTDGVAISASAPDVLLHGGAGSDALAASRGSNVLDGGAGSNFLTGSTGGDGGTDTFFVDARGGGTTWSTLVNFHAGDTATVFGFHAGTSTQAWSGSDGVAGFTGLTLHSEIGGADRGVDASLTFAGATQATMDAHWTVSAGTLSPGTAAATDYLTIQWNR